MRSLWGFLARVFRAGALGLESTSSRLWGLLARGLRSSAGACVQYCVARVTQRALLAYGGKSATPPQIALLSSVLPYARSRVSLRRPTCSCRGLLALCDIAVRHIHRRRHIAAHPLFASSSALPKALLSPSDAGARDSARARDAIAAA